MELTTSSWTERRWRSSTRMRAAAICAAALAACAMAQGPDAQAQSAAPGTAERALQQYELDIAVCTTARFPAPLRDACVREAGQRLDAARSATVAEATR